jgi:hypothetical protein
MAEAARNLGFHTGSVLPETGSREEGLLILGRDVRAVEDLLAKLSREIPKQSNIRAVAGGAVAGAVATFTGLALAWLLFFHAFFFWFFVASALSLILSLASYHNSTIV